MPKRSRRDINSLLDQGSLGRPILQASKDPALLRFFRENSTLLEDCETLPVRLWADGFCRVRISIDYPANATEPALKRSWKKRVLQLMVRAVEFNKKSRRSANKYPPPLLEFLKRRERLEQLKRLPRLKQAQWIKNEIKEEELKGGCSYQSLCNSLNCWIGERLSEAFDLEGDDSPQWKLIGKQYIEDISYAMTVFNISKEDQAEFIKDARSRFDKRQPVINVSEYGAHRKLRSPQPVGPITRRKVEAKIREIRKNSPPASS